MDIDYGLTLFHQFLYYGYGKWPWKLYLLYITLSPIILTVVLVLYVKEKEGERVVIGSTSFWLKVCMLLVEGRH